GTPRPPGGGRMRRLILCGAAVMAAAGVARAQPFPDRAGAHPVGTAGGGRGRRGATDPVTLGLGGTIALAFDDNVIVDAPGPDLLVFENAFLPTGLTTLAPFAATAGVGV